VIDDSSKPLKHVFEPWSYDRTYYSRQLDNVADHFGVSLSTPLRGAGRDDSAAVPLRHRRSGSLRVDHEKRHPREDRALRGRHPELERRHVETDSERARDHIEEYMAVTTCPECEGNPAQRAVATRPRGGHRDHRGERDVDRRGARALRGDGRCAERARDDDRDGNLQRSARGSSWRRSALSTSRSTARPRRSGGESQRIRLATQVGSARRRRALRPRRAVDRAPPARQRPPAEHLGGAPRPRQHPSSSSSTTRRRCAAPTKSSTWGRVPASAAAKWSHRATSTTSSRPTTRSPPTTSPDARIFRYPRSVATRTAS